MKIAALCPTFNRPLSLGRIIESFNRQTYRNRQLIILDDADQYGSQSGDRWVLISQKERYPSLAEKRNALAKMSDADVFAVCDDDDIYLPHWFQTIADSLKNAIWAQPSAVFLELKEGLLTVHKTYRKDINSRLYHGGWAIQRKAFWEVGGYTAGVSVGEDVILAQKLRDKFGPAADPICSTLPYYIFNPYDNPYNGSHISQMDGKTAWDKKGKSMVEKSQLEIGWTRDYSKIAVDPTLRERAASDTVFDRP